MELRLWGGPAAAFIVLTLTAACATSPTGRQQLMLLPEDQMNQIGAQAFQQMKQQTPTVEDTQVERYVGCIAKQILEVAASRQGVRPADQWELRVFDEETVNAFALPGGRIGVYMGMVRFADDADQLAAVIAHEIGHVIAQHGNERLSQQLGVQTGLGLLSILAADTAETRLALAALGVGAQVGILLPYSRDQEREADLIGLRLMSQAGFDPEAAVNLWQKMAKQGGPQPPQFLSTHPTPANRVEALAEQVPIVRREYPARGPVRCEKPNLATARAAEQF